MQFPIFQVPYLGTSMVIALDAVTHVIISHGVAIGMVSLVVISEYLGRRTGNAAWDAFAWKLLRLAVIVTTTIGALTGVGIWFITSALEPRGIGSLLRIFFWPWFTEWVVFTAEVITILIYYFTWQKWQGEKKTVHIRLGVLYVAEAAASAVLITGILGFMLTPDGWPWTGSFWGAFFNPTYAPQLAVRLSGAMSLGALFTLMYLQTAPHTESFRRDAARVFGAVGLGALLLTAATTVWYFSVVPPAFKAYTVFAVFTSALSNWQPLFWPINLLGFAFLLFTVWAAWRNHMNAMKYAIIPAVLLSLLYVSEFERIREFARGPYVIPGYMYANQILLTEKPLYDQHGLLANSYWYNAVVIRSSTASEGQYLFGRNCSVCHTIGGGINDIGLRVRGRSADGIYAIIGHTQEMVPFMSPFTGTDRERRILANYLSQVANGQIKHVSNERFVADDGGAGL